jgi:ABC-2 type transport system ATP-binding protein
MEASITFKSVAKKIKSETLLADLSFGVEKGTRFALVGTNGSGKSSIIKMISGIIQKDKGLIYVKGFDIRLKLNEIKSIIGYMPQNTEFDNDLTIYENISIYGQLYGLDKTILKKRIQDLSKDLDFHEYLNFYPESLSYGLCRVVMFARAVIHNPEIVLLDEPTSNIDPNYRIIIWNYICNSLKDSTIFYTTNNFNDAQDYSNRIAILYNGNIKYNGTFENLVNNAHGLARFTITFRDTIPNNFIKTISLNPKIINSSFSDNIFKFYSTEKKEYFKILRYALDSEIEDVHISNCCLEDIFKGINTRDDE